MENKIASSVRERLTGILPPLSMPFDDAGELAPEALAAQIDFMVAGGVRGVVAGGSTGEGHTLSDREFATAMKAAHDALDGRAAFIAGLIVNSTQGAIERVRMLDGLKVDALQVTPAHYLFKSSPEATIRHFAAIHEATGIPILIYNVIPWNYLSVDAMLRIMDEVPGVVGMKQSSGDLKSVSDLLSRAKPENLVITGIDALLYSAFTLGAHGAISALTCALPEVTVRLFDAAQCGDHETGRRIHFKLNALWNVMPHDNLPACVKYVQHRQGLELFGPRAPMDPVSREQMAAINAALEPILNLTGKAA
ncbi:dihydrodipicolinate synthase family protein [Boseongicola sp. H5]|uniref:dihydrodipicolinate synthase family protein n=1 Tax=Boseongicola sp. H5 TaxID=2763261 RepID=UPI001B0A5FC0|nr:dihydrodipicolinate synthase family protein [Boseongicola sp. H5]MBO6921968.1 dihydrodipicolinate synthase family protein [Roseicyclus sp.]